MISPPRHCTAERRACSPRRGPWATLTHPRHDGAVIVLCWAHARRWLDALLGRGWVVAEWHAAWLDPTGDMREQVDRLRVETARAAP